MKKLILVLALVAIPLTTLIVVSCSKEEMRSPTKTDQTNLSTDEEKSNNCACSISGFWNSCWVSCPVVHGVCLANCIRITIGPWGLSGSVTSCTCGGVGAGRYIVSDGVVYDDQNLSNLEYVLSIIEYKEGFEDLSEKLDALIVAIRGEHADLVPVSQDFFDELAGLEKSQVEYLNVEISGLVESCGRN